MQADDADRKWLDECDHPCHGQNEKRQGGE